MYSITMHHNAPPKQNWQKTTEQTKKPWFCKAFQVGTCYHAKDHENNGKTHRHICAYCLAQGRILTHPEKDCLFTKKIKSPKNDQMAAQQNYGWAARLCQMYYIMWQ